MKQKLIDFFNVIFGFRKFLILLTLYVIGVVFRVCNLLSGDEMVRLIEPTTIAFLGANGVEHIVTAVKDHYANKDNAKTAFEDIVPDTEQESEDLKEESKNA